MSDLICLQYPYDREPLSTVQQEHPVGCMLACIATVTRRSFKDLLGLFPLEGKEGVCTHEVITLLQSLKCSVIEYTSATAGLHSGRLYIISVPSLNIVGGMHGIVVDLRYEGKQIIHDPAKGIEGKKYYGEGGEPLISWAEVLEIVL